MPTIVKGSISILSDAGLGMAMFSLGTCDEPFILFFVTYMLTWSYTLSTIVLVIIPIYGNSL